MQSALCRIAESGRISIPAEFRKAMGLEAGGQVVIEPLQLPGTMRQLEAAKERFAVISDPVIARAANVNQAHWYKLPADPVVRAQRLYIAIRAADDAAYQTLVVVHERDPQGLDAAIWDRLQKAAAPRTT